MPPGGVIIGNAMRRGPVPFAIGLALVVAVAHAQFVVNPARLTERSRNFDWRPDDQPLSCSLSQTRPALDYGFRFQAGYVLRVPLSQYRGKGHRWTVLMRVTPEGGAPVYLMTRYALPEVPKTNVEAEVGGAYLVGEGKYRVAWKLTDDSGRVCRREWTAEARLRRSENKVKVAMTPNTVVSLSNWTIARRHQTDDAPRIRLTVLMHAAAASPRRTR